ncbi:MAG: hypothetical protein AAGH76_16855 [Pseudomonadota bacterium]
MIGIVVAVTGFNGTYIQPVLIGTKELPPVYHWHGFFAALWLLTFLMQSALISARRVTTHRRNGLIGAVAAFGVVATLPMVSFAEVQRVIDAGGESVDNLVGPILDAITFGLLVIAGIATRRRPETHKRWLLLATILLLWVAWVRLRHYFPQFEYNFEVFAFVIGMAPIPIFWWIEWRGQRTVHPILLYGGLAVLAEQGLQTVAYGSTLWSNTACWLYDVLAAA